MLIRYIRDRHYNKVGVVVALEKDQIGWSLCHTTLGDRFDRAKGLTIAISRAEKHPVNIINVLDKEKVPQSIRGDLLMMIGRADRYFQGVAV